MIPLTCEQIKELVVYDPETGIITQRPRDPSAAADSAKCRTWNTRYANKPAGVKTHGYIRLTLRVDGRDVKLYAHRIAWLYMTGEQPPDVIDHINNVGTDNRWSNLRASNKRDNFRNTNNRKRTNKTGLTGVVLLGEGRYMAQITKNGAHLYLGTFPTAEKAHAAYIAALTRIP